MIKSLKLASGFSAYLGSAAGALLLIIVTMIYWPYISNESNIGMAAAQMAPAASEKALYSGTTISIPFTCYCESVGRWMVFLTATADPDNNGYLTLGLDGANKKTIRTSALRKIAGTYFIPLFLPRTSACSNTQTLHLTLKGGDQMRPLMYVPEMINNKTLSLQVALQPETGAPAVMPPQTLFPRSVTEFSPSGRCRVN